MIVNRKLKEEIKKIVNEEINAFLKKKHTINEYLTNDGVYLMQYFNQSDDEKINSLPHMYPWYLDDFFNEMNIHDYDERIGGNMEFYELVEEIESNNKELYKEFGKYLFQKVKDNTLNEPDSNYPAWSFYGSPRLVKNQWLIHFTKDANSIAKDGFLYGVDEIDKLGLTTNLGDFDKKYGGYNFAYLLEDFNKYGYSNRRSNEFKYGDEAVIFNASGVELYHYGDEEPQVIFYGKTAKNIIPIISGENERWGVYSNKTGKLLHENDELVILVNWLVKNYPQYRKHLH